MRRLVNRIALALTGLALTGLAAVILLAAAGLRPPGRRPSWLPDSPDSPVLPPSAPGLLSAHRPWDHPLSLAAASGSLLCLALLLAQALPRTPARLRLHTGTLATDALIDAVRTRATLVPGVGDARARVSRGRRPCLELTARITEAATPADTVDPLLAVLTEAAESTGLRLGLRLRLRPARRSRLRVR
ncbi:hypothetical protein ABZ747_34970 [Kitasatospora cineracea]|uniref:hypothetical protein n=1 Tax=Kitasatospora cineracea TaxID=88074 RepID=UPI0033CAF22D